MRVLILFYLSFLVSCASEPTRQIASDQLVILGEVDASRCIVKLHQTDISQKENFLFYLELRDSRGKMVDVELNEISVRDQKYKLDYLVRRLSKGRYNVIVNEELSDLSRIKFFVQKKVLSHKLVAFQKPVRDFSKIEVIGRGDHSLQLRLTLRDKAALPLETQDIPDVIPEGVADIYDLKLVKKGVWEFSLEYPEQNQIFYLSVRANDILLERVFRFQHVEK